MGEARMPEAEMIQATQATWGNTISLVAILITLMSGYLVAAYLVGSQLGRPQVVIVNTLYLLLSTFLLMSTYNLSIRATEMAAIAIEMSDKRILTPQLWIPMGMISIFSFCLVASLKFMWDVRHPKRE
jgi:hypothetical protein